MSTPGSTPGAGNSPATPASTTGSGAAATLPVALKVSFTLNTPDGLRKVQFGLEKDASATEAVWTIDFTLSERTNATQAFGDPVVSLNVVLPIALHAHAQNVAQNGLTPAQTAHATGPAANAAKAVQAGTMAPAVGNNIIQNTVR